MLMTFSPTRLEAYPDVPTAAECGYAEGSDVVVFRGFLAPVGMPQEAKDAIAAATRYALSQDDVQEFMKNNSFTTDYMDAELFGQLLDNMDQVCNEMTASLGLQNK